MTTGRAASAPTLTGPGGERSRPTRSGGRREGGSRRRAPTPRRRATRTTRAGRLTSAGDPGSADVPTPTRRREGVACRPRRAETPIGPRSSTMASRSRTATTSPIGSLQAHRLSSIVYDSSWQHDHARHDDAGTGTTTTATRPSRLRAADERDLHAGREWTDRPPHLTPGYDSVCLRLTSSDSPVATANSSGVIGERSSPCPAASRSPGGPRTQVWSYPNVHGDIAAIADGAGTKPGPRPPTTPTASPTPPPTTSTAPPTGHGTRRTNAHRHRRHHPNGRPALCFVAGQIPLNRPCAWGLRRRLRICPRGPGGNLRRDQWVTPAPS